jgi:hypothetical protein
MADDLGTAWQVATDPLAAQAPVIGVGPNPQR